MDGNDVLILGLIFGTIIGASGMGILAVFDGNDGELNLLGQRFVRVDAEQTIRWLDEELCCSSDEHNASCPQDMLSCSVIDGWCEKKEIAEQKDECVESFFGCNPNQRKVDCVSGCTQALLYLDENVVGRPIAQIKCFDWCLGGVVDG